jgi:hypothetical protein
MPRRRNVLGPFPRIARSYSCSQTIVCCPRSNGTLEARSARGRAEVDAGHASRSRPRARRRVAYLGSAGKSFRRACQRPDRPEPRRGISGRRLLPLHRTAAPVHDVGHAHTQAGASATAGHLPCTPGPQRPSTLPGTDGDAAHVRASAEDLRRCGRAGWNVEHRADIGRPPHAEASTATA